MIISTLGKTPSGLIDLLCAGASFDDLPHYQLPAPADDLDANSASFAQMTHAGNPVRLGHNFAHGRKPESHHSWQQQFRQIDPIAVAKAIPAGTGDAFSLDEWLDFPAYLRAPAYEEFWGPLGSITYSSASLPTPTPRAIFSVSIAALMNGVSATRRSPGWGACFRYWVRR